MPDGAIVIDAKGRYVMPGIIDTHSHSAIDGSVNECTDVITAEMRVRDVIDAHDVSLYRQLAGGVTAINVLHGSCNAIGGQNAVLKLRWGKTPEELLFKEAPRGIKFALGENVKRSNFRVPGEPRYPGTRMGVEVVLREGFLRARAYKKEWAEYEARLKALPAKADKPVPPRRDLRLETLARHPRRQDPGPLALLPRRRDPDADGRRRRVRLQGADVPARARGLQDRERDREARCRRRHLHRLVGVQDGGATTRSPTTPRSSRATACASRSTPTRTSSRDGSTGTPPRRSSTAASASSRRSR